MRAILARQDNDATTSGEKTMRHALVPVHLIHQARAATPPQALTDAPPDEPKARRARRRARLSRARRSWDPLPGG